MAFQALRRSFKVPFFEGLEPRQLLDGVTAQIAHAYTTPTALYVDVKYKALDAVDVATLSDDDIFVTRAAGVGPALTMAATLSGSPRTDWDGGTVVRYKVDAPDDVYGQWWFGTDNGAYTVSVAAGAVSSISGATTEAADLRTLNLWFNNMPRLEFGLQPLNVLGVGYPGGTLPADSASMDEARVTFWYRMANLNIPIRSVQVTLTGPNGYSRTITTAPDINSFTVPDSTAMARMDVRFPVPKSGSDTSVNGTWDFSDAGTYHATIRFAPTPGDPNPTPVLERDFEVQSSRPQGEIANIEVNADHMVITMRYRSPQGMNLATIGDGDVKVSIPGSGLVSATLLGTPNEADGVVTATYRVDAPANGWASVPTGRVFVRTALDSIFALNGSPLGFALSREVDVSASGRVTGVVTDSYTTPTKLIVVVRYSSDQPVDVTTLGDDDVRLTGPFQYSKFGRLVQVLPQTNGSVIAVYHFTSNSVSGLWDFHTENGTYTATLVAGTVREVNNGDVNAEANLRTYSLWFSTPFVELLEATTPWFGSAEADTSYDNVDAGRVVVRYTTRDWRPLSSHNLSVTMTGPNGFVAELIPDRAPPPYRSIPSGEQSTHTFMFSPPGGGWDFTDNGRYTITVFYGPANSASSERLFVREFDVNIATPHAQVVSTAVTSDAMIVTVRYQAPSGINLSSIGNGDVGLILRRMSLYSFLPFNTWTVNGSLVGSPTVGQSGSVTATYRIGSVNGDPWQAYDFASVVVRPQQVSDNTGNFIGAPLLQAAPMPPAQPDIINVGTLTLTRASWEVEVAFRNPGNLIETNSIRPQNLIVTAPDGRATRVSVVSVTVGLDGTLRARYRIMPQIGTLRLFNGTYTLSLASNSVSQGAAGFLRAQNLASFNMVFP